MFKVRVRNVFVGRSHEATRSRSLPTRNFAITDPATVPTARATRRRRTSRARALNSTLRKAFVLCSAAFLGAFVFGILSDGGRKTAQAKPLIPKLDKLVASLGFGIEFITIEGHRYTSDTDVFDALALKDAHSFVRFDSRSAQSEIEKLPWVKDVTITRVLPNRLDIRVVERQPFAVWRKGSRLHLIDVEGRILSGIDERTAPRNLPRISGIGAPKLAGQLLTLIAGFPQIAQRIREAERIVDRRWRLKLNNGVVIDLPADAESAALARLKSKPQLLSLVDKDDQTIDLRTDKKIIVQNGSLAKSKSAFTRQQPVGRPGSG